MSAERTDELLYDTAATLRLLDAELGELAPRRAPPAAAPLPPPAAVPPNAPAAAAPTMHAVLTGETRVLAHLPTLLERAVTEVGQMLSSLREGREHIKLAATERLKSTHAKLDEVTSATAKAGIDIMDTLDRATGLVDQLDAEQDGAVAGDLRNQLRDELFTVMGHMQFQDITSQQITHAQALLADMESRLEQIAALFDIEMGQRAAPTLPPVSRAVDSRTFDPNATLKDADERQRLADSLTARAAVA
jgi:hypothetical protein